MFAVGEEDAHLPSDHRDKAVEVASVVQCYRPPCPNLLTRLPTLEDEWDSATT